jgi:hypothetical protein
MSELTGTLAWAKNRYRAAANAFRSAANRTKARARSGAARKASHRPNPEVDAMFRAFKVASVLRAPD